MHGNANMIWNNMTRLRAEGCIWHEIIRKLFSFVKKVNFKATPIERQSL